MISKIGKIIKKIFRDRDSLEPLDFEVKLEVENTNSELVAIEFENDDITSMEFVVKILEGYFHFDREESVKLMFDIHSKGIGRVQWIEAETANRLIEKIALEANRREFPFVCRVVQP